MHMEVLDRNIGHLSYNAKRSLLRGIAVGIGSVLAYLLVVVVTTPALPPAAAINAAVMINPIIIAGIGIGVGLQMFIATYSKGMGCRLSLVGKAKGSNSASAGMTGFFSFFALVPLGCCGTILYMLSLLPSILGASLTAGLMNYSQPLAYLGIGIIFTFNGIMIYKLRKEMVLHAGKQR